MCITALIGAVLIPSAQGCGAANVGCGQNCRPSMATGILGGFSTMPVRLTAVEIPLEAAEPIMSADEPQPAESEAVVVQELPATARTPPLIFLFGLIVLGAALAVFGVA